MDESVKKSLPESETLYGVVIERAPLGRYLEIMKILKAMPVDLIKICMPDVPADKVLPTLSKFNHEMLSGMLQNALLGAPEYVFKTIAALLSVDYEKLIENKEIGLFELTEILKAFWRINRMSDFIQVLKQKLPTLKAEAGKVLGSKVL